MSSTRRAPILDAAQKVGAHVWVVNEYTHLQVSRPILINRALARDGYLVARPGPFGRQLETFASRAFAVCDHQIAHVYIRDDADRTAVRHRIEALDGVAAVYEGAAREEIGLDHPRAGDVVALAHPDAWFAYPFWLDDGEAPDYARTVDIHRKPGYDPCELFFDPALRLPKLRVMRRLAGKLLGFRALFDVIPLDPILVKGSHGLHAPRDEDCPVLIASGASPAEPAIRQTALRDRILHHLDLE